MHPPTSRWFQVDCNYKSLYAITLQTAPVNGLPDSQLGPIWRGQKEEEEVDGRELADRGTHARNRRLSRCPSHFGDLR